MTIVGNVTLPREFGTQADAAAGGLFGAADHANRRHPRRSRRRRGRRRCRAGCRARPRSRRRRSPRARSRVSSRAPNTVMPWLAQERDHVVLGRAVVTRGDDFGAACSEHLEQHCGLRLDMQRHADATSGERLPGGEFSTGGGEERHPRSDPGSASGTALERVRSWQPTFIYERRFHIWYRMCAGHVRFDLDAGDPREEARTDGSGCARARPARRWVR